MFPYLPPQGRQAIVGGSSYRVAVSAPAKMQTSPTRNCPTKWMITVLPETCPVKVPSPLAPKELVNANAPLNCPPNVNVPENVIWLALPLGNAWVAEPLNVAPAWLVILKITEKLEVPLFPEIRQSEFVTVPEPPYVPRISGMDGVRGADSDPFNAHYSPT